MHGEGNALRPDLSRAPHNVFVAGELLGPDGTAGVKLAGGNADLRSHAEFAAIGELGRGIDQQDGRIDATQEFFCCRRIPVTIASV